MTRTTRTGANLWERQHGESSKAYAAFLVYRDLGADRGVVAAYRKHSGRSTAQQASGQWNQWFHWHTWEPRARAYDSHLAMVEQKAHEKALVEKEKEWMRRRDGLREEGWQTGEALMAKAEQMLRMPIITTTHDVIEEERADADGVKRQTIKRTVIEPARWTMADAARMKAMGLELKQAAAGLTNDPATAEAMPSGGTGETLTEADRDARLLELLERARSRQQAAQREDEESEEDKDGLGRLPS